VASATYAYLFIDVPKVDERMQRPEPKGAASREDAEQNSGSEAGSPQQTD
jgi:hypothetical protein